MAAPMRIGNVQVTPKATIVFLGPLLAYEHDGPAKRGAGLAWSKFWTRRHLLTTPVPLKYRLQRLRSEFLPALSWGATSWHMTADSSAVLEHTIHRMTRICMRLLRPGTVDEVTRQQCLTPSRAPRWPNFGTAWAP